MNAKEKALRSKEKPQSTKEKPQRTKEKPQRTKELIRPADKYSRARIMCMLDDRIKATNDGDARNGQQERNQKDKTLRLRK